MVQLGEWLLAQRKAAGLELAALSENTKINPRHLDALERGDLGSLPTRVHARAFALAYARACDADEDEAVSRVNTAFDSEGEAKVPGTSAGPASSLPKDEPAPAPSKQPWRLWIALALGVALCLWGLNSLVSHFKAKAQAAKLAQAPGPAVAAAQPESITAQVEGDVLSLRAKRPCWVVLEIDGKRLPTVLLEPEVKELWRVREKAVMLAGNIGAVRVWWRGENLGYFGELGERMNGVVFEAGQPWRKDSSLDLALPPGVPSQAAH